MHKVKDKIRMSFKEFDRKFGNVDPQNIRIGKDKYYVSEEFGDLEIVILRKV